MRDTNREIESFWTRRLGWLAIGVAVVVSVLGFLVDRLLAFQMSRTQMLLFTNTLTGIVAGGLFYQLARHAKAQREAMRARMATIAEMNHHIRNALQVIRGLSAFPPDPSYQDEQIQMINESVERVEWALREVLPKYPAGEIAPPPTSSVKHFAAVIRSAAKIGKKQERNLHRPA